MTELRAWIGAPPEPVPNRDELVLKAYLCWVAPEGVAAMLRAEAERLEAEAARFASLATSLRARTTHAPIAGEPDFGSLATLRLGSASRKESAKWCAWLAGELERPATRARAKKRKKK